LIAKLDKLILKTFIGPFIATFFIALFAIVIQHFWKYIDEMVGKGIDFLTLMQMIGIVSMSIGVLFALPISVLLASLMTFGNLGESYELVAIKASGISLLRFMRPIFFLILFICGLAFLFNNYIIPKANLKFYTMLSDIRISKPSFDIKEGEFYTGIGNYAIQIEKKDDKKGLLKNIVIYENANNNYQDNFITADSGRMVVSNDKRSLDFILYNGERIQERGKEMNQNTDFIRIQFKEYKKTFDISSMMLKKTNDTINKDFYKALNLSQLNFNIDSLNKVKAKFSNKIKPGIQQNLKFLQVLNDSTWKENAKENDSLAKVPYKNIFPDSAKENIARVVAEKFNTVKSTIESELFDYNNKSDSLRYHKMEWHRKYTFSVICLVMFLIGAPMGAIIRKGGLGTPLLIAIIFFVIYFIFFSIGEKNANADTLTPFQGLWLPVFILLPVGLYLVYQARRDSQIFSKEFYYKILKPIKNLILRRRPKLL
jgi:lipopolysaccharide export system permease protein